MAVIAAAIYSCSSPSPEAQDAETQATITGDAPAPTSYDAIVAEANPIRSDFDDDRAKQAAQSYLSDETYEGAQGSGDCTDDCSGHDAGWQWAKDGNSRGSGDSASFDAGCRAFEEAADERVEDARQRYADGESTFEQD
ncbi:hypothetical protein [Sphingomonas sp. Leaf17]|uniref:hypothetical protein n=1 Tax=Sphingomonas sp. Leaf17 TaxID=1735683 RepID=UPI0012E0EF01|nr:hypothetical protein [Sphingomonas sp. Leaf17]